MKTLLISVGVAILAGCGSHSERLAAKSPAAAAAPAATQVPPAAAVPDFELTTYEVVATSEEDTLEYVQVFVDGRLQGRTETAAKSRSKFWRGDLPEGNWLMRFEVWDSTDGVSGVRRPDELQPRERFFRVEPGKKTFVTLKLTDQGRQSALSIAREPK